MPNGQARELGRCKQPIQIMPISGFRGQAGQHGAHEIGYLRSLLRMPDRNIVSDHSLTGSIQGRRRLSRFPIVAPRTFYDEAAASVRISRVAACSFLKHRRQRFRYRPVGSKDVVQGNCAGARPSLQDSSVKPGLVAEGGIKARWIYAERLSHLGDANGIVAARMEELLSRSDRLLPIEAPRAASATSCFCISHYINLDRTLSGIM